MFSFLFLQGQFPREARHGSRVAHVPVTQALHPYQHGVLIAIGEESLHAQPIAGGFPLGPQRVAGAAEEGDIPGAAGSGQAASFMKPTISTCPLSSSCTTAGINPESFVKSMAMCYCHRHVQQKKALSA